jgi:hypothetical protein
MKALITLGITVNGMLSEGTITATDVLPRPNSLEQSHLNHKAKFIR